MYDIAYTMSMQRVHNACVGYGCVDVAAMESQVIPLFMMKGISLRLLACISPAGSKIHTYSLVPSTC